MPWLKALLGLSVLGRAPLCEGIALSNSTDSHSASAFAIFVATCLASSFDPSGLK